MLFDIAESEATNGLRMYSNVLSVDINDKGVLDIDTVKGCSQGISAHGPKGCYQACYAANIAKFRGIDFSKSVTRNPQGPSHKKAIEKIVSESPLGFFRIGTMGDPSHNWQSTTDLVKWLAPYSVPVIITKHWKPATDEQFRELVNAGAIINTSVSAIDTDAHLRWRLSQIKRYENAGGFSVARVVSCDFVEDNEEGRRKKKIQDELMSMGNVIDNPLRATLNNPLVVSGLIRVRKVWDLQSDRYISLPSNSKTYIGHCSGCSELCGAGMLPYKDMRPQKKQYELAFKE